MACLKIYWGSTIVLVVLLVLSSCVVDTIEAGVVPFDLNYNITWGKDHVTYLNHGREIHLSLDKSSGAGFASRLSYGSGLFVMRIKLHDKDSAGVVSGFYLNSISNHHDELDVEFLGNREGKPYTLQTNVYIHGIGGREQRFHLWFDPAADFHDYKILWNEHQIVFYVEDVPIRVLKNKPGKGMYPSQPMQVDGTIWDGDDWATDGGQTKTNWSHAPFKIHFQHFNIDGCPTRRDSNIQHCFAPNYWWNSNKFWDLSMVEQTRYEKVRKEFMYYDYCNDKSKHDHVPPPECL